MTKTFPAARTLAIAVAMMLASLTLAATAGAQALRQEEREGAQIQRDIQDGKRSCRELSNDDFERVGEYAMGRIAGSTKAHESMNSLMRSMMGARGEEQMHVFMGRRSSGCGGGQIPGSFGAMMGAMGGMGGPGATYSGGPGSAARGDDGSMMGGRGMNFAPGSGAGSDNDDNDGAAVAMVVVMLGLLVLAGVGLWLLRPRHRRAAEGESANDILARRYASGEIDTEEYERRRQALGGSA